MNIEGFTPLKSGEYEAYRTRQISIADIQPDDAEYRMVGLLDSAAPEAALITITDIQTFEHKSGRVALHAMLLSDTNDAGIRPFRGYEESDTQGRSTLYTDNPRGMQLFVPQYGRFQLTEGYLIALAGKHSLLNAHDSVDQAAVHLEPIDYFTGGPFYMR